MDSTDIEEPIVVETEQVSCDGGSGASGHPNVYLSIGKEGQIVCPYCSRIFVLAEGSADGSGH
ncbi:MAG: zinc-finger domain-containing protein [Rhodospirillales bacterium]|jgi:uncharacterized Zn-finger protein